MARRKDAILRYDKQAAPSELTNQISNDWFYKQFAPTELPVIISQIFKNLLSLVEEACLQDMRWIQD